MKTAIVTGATGFIGAHLCKELYENDIDVKALVRHNSHNAIRIKNKAELVECVMDDYDNLQDVKADVFYHLAWEGATGPGRDDELLQVKNVHRTISAMHAAKRAGCKRFVALGTVYENLVLQIMQNKQHHKADFYLLSKQNAHYMCQKLAAKLGIEFVWATIFQPIGRYIKEDQVMAYAVKGLINGEAPKFGPAKEPYDITAVEDIAYGLRLLGESSLSSQEYYIGSGNPMIMKEYLMQIKKVLQSDTELEIGTRLDDGLRFSFDWYDISTLEKDTGYKTRVSFEQAVWNMAQWIKSGERT